MSGFRVQGLGFTAPRPKSLDRAGSSRELKPLAPHSLSLLGPRAAVLTRPVLVIQQSGVESKKIETPTKLDHFCNRPGTHLIPQPSQHNAGFDFNSAVA